MTYKNKGSLYPCPMLLMISPIKFNSNNLEINTSLV